MNPYRTYLEKHAINTPKSYQLFKSHGGVPLPGTDWRYAARRLNRGHTFQDMGAIPNQQTQRINSILGPMMQRQEFSGTIDRSGNVGNIQGGTATSAGGVSGLPGSQTRRSWHSHAAGVVQGVTKGKLYQDQFNPSALRSLSLAPTRPGTSDRAFFQEAFEKFPHLKTQNILGVNRQGGLQESISIRNPQFYKALPPKPPFPWGQGQTAFNQYDRDFLGRQQALDFRQSRGVQPIRTILRNLTPPSGPLPPPRTIGSMGLKGNFSWGNTPQPMGASRPITLPQTPALQPPTLPKPPALSPPNPQAVSMPKPPVTNATIARAMKPPTMPDMPMPPRPQVPPMGRSSGMTPTPPGPGGMSRMFGLRGTGMFGMRGVSGGMAGIGSKGQIGSTVPGRGPGGAGGGGGGGMLAGPPMPE